MTKENLELFMRQELEYQDFRKMQLRRDGVIFDATLNAIARLDGTIQKLTEENQNHADQ